MRVSTLQRYERIAPLYDLLDLPFELRRYRKIRPLLFRGLTGRVLDAGVGTGRNIPFYPSGAEVIGIDFSAAMLSQAEHRRRSLGATVKLYQMDVTRLGFPDRSFDAAVVTFLFCVLPDDLQVPALRELGRVVKPQGKIRILNMCVPGALREGLSPGYGNHGSLGHTVRATTAVQKSACRKPVSNSSNRASSWLISSNSSKSVAHKPARAQPISVRFQTSEDLRLASSLIWRKDGHGVPR